MEIYEPVARELIEAEREACIRILEDLRPRNDREDWTQWAKDRDEVLVKAIALIAARYDAGKFVPARTCHPDDRGNGDCHVARHIAKDAHAGARSPRGDVVTSWEHHWDNRLGVCKLCGAHSAEAPGPCALPEADKRGSARDA